MGNPNPRPRPAPPLDRAVHVVGAGEQHRRRLDVPLEQELADLGRADREAVRGDGLDDVQLHPPGAEQAPQGVDAGPLVPRGEVVPHHHLRGAEPADQVPLDEVGSGGRRPDAVERLDHGGVQAERGGQLELPG